jgi:hypothetical protein
MRYLLLVIFLSAGCASREQISNRNADMDIANYGPGCERLGLKPRTPDWASCVASYGARHR